MYNAIGSHVQAGNPALSERVATVRRRVAVAPQAALPRRRQFSLGTAPPMLAKMARSAAHAFRNLASSSID